MKGKKIQKQKPTGKKISPIVSKTAKLENRKKYLALAVILLISFLVYLPVLTNGLLAWDDNAYIRDNQLVLSFNLKDIFSQYVMGNYHPLTVLALAIEYKFFGLNATGYHTVNLLLHLLNTALVFFAMKQLSEKYQLALVAALLFGVHPIHVESVAWAAELKDLLYTSFFLTSWIFYMKYLKGFQKKYIFIALLLFLLSLLSKAMAVSLPLVLILTDYFKGRKINAKSILDKLPFFLLAIILGAVAVMAQKTSIAVEDIANFTLLQRIIFACYGFISYLYKIIIPLNLSAFYSYPIKGGDSIPAQYYVYLLLFLAVASFAFYSLRFSKKIFFGIGFFAVTVFLVLQLLPVGTAIMADRYSYIPSIGIFFLFGEGFTLLWNMKMKVVPIFLLSAFTIFFSIKTFEKSKIWYSDLTLWNDAINQDPTISVAYNNRGNFLMDEKKYDQALLDFNKAIELKENYYQAYGNRGLIYMNQNKFKQALDDYNKAISLNQNFTDVYINRGSLFRDNSRHEEALRDYNKAIELKPQLPIAYFNRGTLFMNEKRKEEALSDFNKAIELNPGYYQAYHNRGNIFTDEKKYDEAIKNYSKAIELKADYSISYYSRGLAAYNSGKKEAACIDMKQAENLGYRPASDFIKQICR
ncbi:MAG TPA: tetratricopeptide repeat protein [Chitinophagaceae bacterium]|nr:tetratricopeptide repeat protein [Chitinophagaceae bacterium]